MSSLSELSLGDLDRYILPALLLFMAFSGFFVFNGFLEWDEASFLMNAEAFSGDSSNFEESRPAALSFLLSIIWRFTGESVLAARLVVLSFGIGTLAVFYRLAELEFEEPAIPTAVLAFSPLMIYWSSRFYTDVPALFFILSSLLAYRKQRYLYAGILVSVAATFRYLFLVFALGFLAAALIDRRESVVKFCLGGLVGATPFLSYSLFRYGGPFSRIRMYVSRVTRWSDSGAFASLIPNMASAGEMLSGLIPLTVLGWRKALTVEKALIVSYSVFMIVFSGNSYSRYWLAVLPLIILVSYRVSDRRLFAAGSVIMILVSGLSVYQGYQNHQQCAEPLNDALDYAEGLQGEFVSDSWAIAGYRLDSKVHSTWTSYDELRSDYGVDYAVVSEKLNYTVLKSAENSCRTYYVYDLSSTKES